jgi:hypothetical protein
MHPDNNLKIWLLKLQMKKLGNGDEKRIFYFLALDLWLVLVVCGGKVYQEESMTGECLGNNWGNAWGMPGNARGMHGQCRAMPKEWWVLVVCGGKVYQEESMAGEYLGNAWKMPGECPGNARGMPGECPGNARGMSGWKPGY